MENTIIKTGTDGILIEHGWDSKIKNNIVQESGSVGIIVSGYERNLVQGNFINQSGWSGLIVTEPRTENSIVASNTVTNK